MSFSVEITSKSGGAIKGVHQASFASGALVLQKNAKSEAISIPVGTPAHCESATVNVAYKGAPLSMRVLGVTLDNQKLAADLAGYLSGNQPQPQVEQFKMPGYLLALAFLPIAIPIVTLGGAIPAGIAGSMVLACLMLAKKNQIAAPLRAIGIVAITIVGFVATFAILAVFVANRGR